VPRETITIDLARYSPRQVVLQYLSILAEPLDLRARRNLIEARYRLLELQITHIGAETATKRDAKLHKRALRAVEDRMVCTEFVNAYLQDRIVKLLRRELPDARGQGGINELWADGERVGPFTIETFCAWGANQISGRPCAPYEDAAKNFRQRQWRPAKVVLHLLLAYRWIAQDATQKGEEFASAAGFDNAAHLKGTAWFTQPEGVVKLLGVAEELRGVLIDTASRAGFELEDPDTIKVVAR
jgi:hypothetical protein